MPDALAATQPDLLRLATAGSVDDGKSTLIGRLLYDTKSIMQDQLDEVAALSEQRSAGHLDLSLVTDGLRAEVEQGITIDVAYRYFATPRRRFVLADTPGHVQYTRNMVTATSTASLSLVLVDARKGVLEQTRRHTFIASLLHVPHLVICINKMDTVDWSERAYDEIVAEFSRFTSRIDIADVTFIPVSALAGDNVVEPSAHMPWYRGPPLLYHLERVHIAADHNLLDARFPARSVVGELDAMVCWMASESLCAGRRLVVKHTTRTVQALAEEIVYRIDVNTLHRDESAVELRLNDIGRVRLRLSAPLAVDAYRHNRATGSFIVIDETTNQTVGGGMVPHPAIAPQAVDVGGRSANVVWSPSALTRAERWRSLGQSGATLWLTGLPASGKSTLAVEVERRLVIAGRQAYRLDGDNLRHGLNGDLAFDAASRSENVRRTAHVAALLADSGAVAIVSLVSPYAADREAARTVHEQADVPFVEVFVDTPLDECERRDPKGLYARARRGEIEAFTGISDRYDEPAEPEARVAGVGGAVDAQVAVILAALARASSPAP